MHRVLSKLSTDGKVSNWETNEMTIQLIMDGRTLNPSPDKVHKSFIKPN